MVLTWVFVIQDSLISEEQKNGPSGWGCLTSKPQIPNQAHTRDWHHKITEHLLVLVTLQHTPHADKPLKTEIE